jgi:tripartite ATP-independent transporter DctM subunit
MFELFTPIIIVGGIITGIFTPTEAAMIAVAYALFLEAIVRREITLKQLPGVIFEAGKLTGIIMFILATAQSYSWILVREQAGQALVQKMTALTTNPVILLLFLLTGLLLLGAFIEPIACIILSLPVVSPLAGYLGLDPVHLGVIVVLAVMLGMITPPVGYCMYIICAIAKIDMWVFFRNVFPFFIALVLVLITIAFFPFLTLWLPNLIMGH